MCGESHFALITDRLNYRVGQTHPWPISKLDSTKMRLFLDGRSESEEIYAICAYGVCSDGVDIPIAPVPNCAPDANAASIADARSIGRWGGRGMCEAVSSCFIKFACNGDGKITRARV